MNFLNIKLLILILISNNNIYSTTQSIPNSTNALFYTTCLAKALLAVSNFKDLKLENTLLDSPKTTIKTIILAESKPKKSLFNITKYSNTTKKIFPKKPKASRQSFANCKRTT